MKPSESFSLFFVQDEMAHPYGGSDCEFVWDAAQADVEELRAIYESQLS